MNKYSLLIALSGVIIASFAQILMKSSARTRIENNFLRKFLNIRVILGYSMMLLSSFLSVASLKYLPLKFVPVIEATGFIWVPLLSMLFLKEKPTKNNIIGGLIIITGMCIFACG